MNSLIVIFLISYGLYALFNNFIFWIIYILLIGLYYYLTQVKFFQTKWNTLRKKIIIATWGAHTDPQIYADIKLNITKMEEYLEIKSKEVGEKITLTVYIIKLMSMVLKKYPEMYGAIKFGRVIILI